MYRLEKARVEDAPRLQALVARYAAQDVMLPRTVESIVQTLPDWVVAVQEPESPATRRVLGGVCLTALAPELAEVRSLVVDPDWQGEGIGRRLVERIVDMARARGYQQLCALTLVPGFFLGWVSDQWTLRTSAPRSGWTANTAPSTNAATNMPWRWTWCQTRSCRTTGRRTSPFRRRPNWVPHLVSFACRSAKASWVCGFKARTTALDVARHQPHAWRRLAPQPGWTAKHARTFQESQPDFPYERCMRRICPGDWQTLGICVSRTSNPLPNASTRWSCLERHSAEAWASRTSPLPAKSPNWVPQPLLVPLTD